MKPVSCLRPSRRIVLRGIVPRTVIPSRSIITCQNPRFTKHQTSSAERPRQSTCLYRHTLQPFQSPLRALFHISPTSRAQPPTADALMESLNELYATAKDEFEIAMEETEGNTVYAADDRQAAIEAFRDLKKAYEKSVKESDPETGKEVQSRVGQRIRELEAAIENMEKMAMEGD